MEPQHHRPTLLDLPVSIFRRTLETLPEDVTTLRRIVGREQIRPAIEAIRAEPDEVAQKNLKGQLRAFTSVARLHHRKASTSFAERVAEQWPLLCGDVDNKENPRVDMANLKAKISRLPYVLLCAYSVRGGLWFVVRLPDYQTPETLAGHFRHLQRLFGGRNEDGKSYGKFGVKLDESKGGNPTDLRYVSYDAAPYINDAATVIIGTCEPPQPEPRPFALTTDADTKRARVEVCIKEVARQGTYIGANYGDWYAVGCSLANGFGESGRDYYHQVSQHYPGYRHADTDKQFTACLRGNSKATLGTFFKFCADVGIEWKQLMPYTPPQRSGPARSAPPPAPPETPKQNNTWVRDGQTIHGELL